MGKVKRKKNISTDTRSPVVLTASKVKRKYRRGFPIIHVTCSASKGLNFAIRLLNTFQCQVCKGLQAIDENSSTLS